MDTNELVKALLTIEELKIKAQLRAVREALKSDSTPKQDDLSEHVSQIVYVYNILKEEKKPLHIMEIIAKIKKTYDVELFRESIVSALIKKVARFDRFYKTDKNTFGLIEYRDLYNSENKER